LKNIEPVSDDITEFVNILSANPIFNRTEFDEFVADLLDRYEITEIHKILAGINWKEIITTNMDLVIEKSFDAVKNTPRKNLKIIPIRSWDRYSYRCANDEVKYVKLNGCLFDKRKYPLVFSSQDFENSNKFYKTVLRGLVDLSPKIQFLSIGYSFKDPFAKKLLDKFDKFNYRGRRWIIRLDPSVSNSELPYFTDNRICVIKASAEEFFKSYEKWKDEQGADIVLRNKIQYRTKDNEIVKIPSDVTLRLGNNLTQLSHSFQFPFVSAKQFYQGIEPTYEVVKKDYDVKKSRLLENILVYVKRALEEENTIVPIIALKGGFGIGKTTLTYRVLKMLLEDSSIEVVGFEIKSPLSIRTVDLRTVFNEVKSKNIILIFDRIEVDSSFKSLLDLRHQISVEQFSEYNILFLTSIRENILQKYKLLKKHYGLIEIDAEERFSKSEINELIDKIKGSGILRFKDAREKNQLTQKINKFYKGDTFVSLLSVIKDSNHVTTLIDAYNQLSDKTKEAFMFTSLLHRFMILTPATLLQRLISIDWEHFKREILDYDCKGILINEIIHQKGSYPDLYFRTKHPVLANMLIITLFPDEDARFEKYSQMIRHLNLSDYNATLLIDLFKSLSFEQDLQKAKIDKLFDLCANEFGDNQHFSLHYAINLQLRKKEGALLKGIEIVKYAESTSERRNSKLIHRRAVLNYYMAKIVFNRETELVKTIQYLKEARELFNLKLAIDPFSIYSYKHYIELEVWVLEKMNLIKSEQFRHISMLENLFRQAEKLCF